MSDFSNIINEINTNIADNNTQSITAKKLRDTLIDLTNAIETQQDNFEDVVSSGQTSFETLITNQQSTFESSVNDTLSNMIVNNLSSTSTTKALSANMGQELKKRCFRFIITGADNTMKTDKIYCYKDHKYLIMPDHTDVSFTGVTYTTSGYALLAIYSKNVETDTTTTLYYRGCNDKTSPLRSKYTVVADTNGELIINMRATTGEIINFYIEDITELDSQIDGVETQINAIQDTLNEMNFEPFVIRNSEIDNYELISTNVCYIVSQGNCLGYSLSDLGSTSLSGVKTYKIPIEKGKYKYVRFRQFNSTSNYGSPMFDENDQFVGYMGYNSTINGSRTWATSIIPSTATYILYTTFGYNLYLYEEDPRLISQISDDLYGKETFLRVRTSNETDIFNFNYCRGNSTGFLPSAIGNNVFDGSFVHYYGSGYYYYLVPIYGYDILQFTTFKTNSTYGSLIVDKDGNVIDTIYRNYDGVTPPDGGTATTWTKPYEIPADAMYLIMAETSNASTYSIYLKKNKSIGGNDNESQSIGISGGLTIKKGYYNSNGVFVNDEKKAVISGVNYWKPFTIAVHSGYTINRIYMFDFNDNMVNYTETVYTSTSTSYSRSLYLRPYYLKFEISKTDGSEIDLNDNIVSSYYQVDERFERMIPDNSKWNLYTKRANQMKSITWKALYKIPQCGSYNTNYFKAGTVNRGVPYSEAAEFSKYVGWNVSFTTFLTALQNKRSVMYTENISPENRRSYYNIAYNGLNNLTSSYYGTVCTGFTTYLIGLNNTIVSTNWPSIPGMNVIALGRHNTGQEMMIGSSFSTAEPATPAELVDILQPMDIVWNNGHCWTISDIYVDKETGDKYPQVSEETQPRTSGTFYSVTSFGNRLNNLINTAGDGYNGYKEWKIYRYTNWSTLTSEYKFDIDTEKRIINTTSFNYSPAVVKIDPEICTYEGDYVAFSTNNLERTYTQKYIVNYTQISVNCLANNNIAILNCHRGHDKYTKLQIYKMTDGSFGTPPAEYSLSNGNDWISQCDIYEEDAPEKEDWINFDLKKITTPLTAGLYQARLSNDDSSETSGYVHFEMVDISLSFEKDASENYTVSFSSSEGSTPYLIRQETVAGMYRMRHDITAEELAAGQIVFPYSSTTSYQTIQGITYDVFLKLYVQGTYGDVVMRVVLWNGD